MPSIFGGLNTALSGLTAAQIAMDTAAHNVANANTDGYSRQRVTLTASDPYTYPTFNRSGLPGQIGTGVAVASIDRVRDAFVDLQIRQENPLLGQWETYRDELAKVESVFPEPGDSGLGGVLSKFWGAWQDMAANPTSTAARAALVEQSSTLAARFNRDAGQVTSLIAGLDYQVGQQVGQINDLATRIAGLNEQIRRVVATGDHANDLADQRDAFLDQLSKIVPITIVPQNDGTATVLVGGIDLVAAGDARKMTTSVDANGNQVPTWASGAPVSVTGGQLGALMDLRDTGLPGYLQQLDQLAAGIADAVNALHVSSATNATYDGHGDPGVAFFTYTPGEAASSIAVNADIVADPLKVAIADASGEPGNAVIAGKIADLQDAKLFSSGTQTAGDAYASLVGLVGSDSRQASQMAGNEDLVLQHLTQRRESLSGVTLDEEATDMIRFQRAYQAATRVITVMDEMLDKLINGTGTVGR